MFACGLLCISQVQLFSLFQTFVPVLFTFDNDELAEFFFCKNT